jgi:hypothetical protein
MSKDNPTCYGRYGTGDCEACPQAEWCVDAGDPPAFQERTNFRSYAVNFEGFDTFDTVSEISEGGELSKLLGELIYALDTDNADLLWDFLATMSALSKEHPCIYKVVRVRVLYPKETYQALADRLGITRQAVDLHLKRCVELMPALKAAMPSPRQRLSKAELGPFSIKCASGSINLLAAGVAIMQMRQSEDNDKSAPLVVKALNNMHWRKRDALLEEV